MKSSILNLKSSILIHWPIIALIVLDAVLFFANYKPGTYLSGWDNLHPEFWPEMNIKRSIFAVWQEYQSLGLLGGMGHASDLVRQLYILFLTLILPLNMVRYVSTFTALLFGGIGAYFLTRYILQKSQWSIVNCQLSAMLASLFYTLNIATIQTFYVPYEAFYIHFAALPWLILASINYLGNRTRNALVFLIIVLLLSTPASYIPTLFVVFILSLGICILTTLIFEKNRIAYIARSAKLALIIFAVNGFWLLPFLYFTLANAQINVNAKINYMATEGIVLQNKEFGILSDTALLRGFWFNNIDPDASGNFTFMLQPWRQHFNNPLVLAAGILLFGIILAGAIYSVYKFYKNPQLFIFHFSFFILFLFSFTMLATDTLPFLWINELFRKVPLFEQAFRFPFTKFSTLTSLTYSIMLAFGVTFIIERIRNYEFRIMRIIPYSLFIILSSAILWIAWPSFQGHLFYEKNRTNIPGEYFDTFDFFKKQDPNTRIANLPQPTFWGWTFYKWPAPPSERASLGGGYGGSGFPWYGIKQPMLDRAFDVWSSYSENYYFELSHALYSQNPIEFENVLNKYHISFILYDKNVIYPQSPKTLLRDETQSLLAKLPSVKKFKSFGNIDIYKAELRDKPHSFLFAKSGELPSVQPYSWNDNDKAYEALGTYLAPQQSTINNPPAGEASQQSTFVFPFSLFSQKTSKEQDFVLLSTDEGIELSKIFNNTQASILKLPPFYENEKLIPFEVSIMSDIRGNTIITGEIRGPKVVLDDKKILEDRLPIPLFLIGKDVSYPLNLNINGVSNIKIEKRGGDTKRVLRATFLTSAQDNLIVITGTNFQATKTVSKSIFLDLRQNSDINFTVTSGTHELIITVPKVDDEAFSLSADIKKAKVENCNSFRSGDGKIIRNGGLNIKSRNTTFCASFYSNFLAHDEAYAIFAEAKNISGRSFHFWVLNEDNKSVPVDTFFDRKPATNVFVLPPYEARGQGYSFHFDNVSIGKDESENILYALKVFPIPHRFITNIRTESSYKPNLDSIPVIQSVSHPNESLYVVKLKAKSQKPKATLILSQSYDSGWHAYRIMNYESRIMNYVSLALPFLFGTEIKEHVLVNNWANGWLLAKQSTINNPPAGEAGQQSIIIVYLPQYLEYAGFTILLITIAFIFLKFAISNVEWMRS